MNCIFKKSREWGEVILKWQEGPQVRASCAQAPHLAPHTGHSVWEIGMEYKSSREPQETSPSPSRSWSGNAVTLAALSTLHSLTLQRNPQGLVKLSILLFYFWLLKQSSPNLFFLPGSDGYFLQNSSHFPQVRLLSSYTELRTHGILLEGGLLVKAFYDFNQDWVWNPL